MYDTEIVIFMDDLQLVVSQHFLQFALLFLMLVVVLPSLLFEFVHRLVAQPSNYFGDVLVAVRSIVPQLLFEDQLVKLQSSVVGLITLISRNLLPSRTDIGHIA
jgi:hypothetical protein